MINAVKIINQYMICCIVTMIATTIHNFQHYESAYVAFLQAITNNYQH